MTKEEANTKKQNNLHLIDKIYVKVGLGFKMQITRLEVCFRPEDRTNYYVSCDLRGEKQSYSEDLDIFLRDYYPIG